MKKFKRIIIGMFAFLLLIGGMFTSSPVQASEYVGFDPMCITGGPANTLTFRIPNQVHGFATATATTTNSYLWFPAGSIVTAPSGASTNGRRLVTRNFGQGAMTRGWVPTNWMTPILTC